MVYTWLNSDNQNWNKHLLINKKEEAIAITNQKCKSKTKMCNYLDLVCNTHSQEMSNTSIIN